MSLVLSVGFDLPLLRIRTILLEQEGYLVQECHMFSEVLICIDEGHPDLVMICHSVPREARDQMIQLIRELDKFLPIVCIEPNAYHGIVGNCDSTQNDPELLLAQLKTTINLSQMLPPPRPRPKKLPD